MTTPPLFPAAADRPLDAPLPDYCECHKEVFGETVPAVTIATLVVGDKTARAALCGQCATLLIEVLDEAEAEAGPDVLN